MTGSLIPASASIAGGKVYTVSRQLPQPTLPPGRLLFAVTGLIGRGGLGRVDRIRVTASNAQGMVVGSEWAAKRLNEKWRNHPAARLRFEREISACKAMSHPNIVSCHAENLPGQERFYVMPVFETTVRRCIAGGGYRGDWRAVAQLGAILANALRYAHDLGFIHRDLKPDNLLFNANGPVVIADWGLGYFVHCHSQVLQHLTVGGMGTEYYCSAEQWATGKCDCRGDIYSLGMTLDEWVTGRQRAIRIGEGVNGPATAELTLGAQRFNALLTAMTQRSRLNRPANMAIVAAHLQDVAETP